jgi:hypothetical protein
VLAHLHAGGVPVSVPPSIAPRVLPVVLRYIHTVTLLHRLMLTVSMCGDLLMGHRTTLRYLVCRVNAPALRQCLGVVMRLLLQHESMGSLRWLLLTPHVHLLRMPVMH